MLDDHVISFCLWGDNPDYTVGAIRNMALAPTIYPGWICWIYVGNSVPEVIVARLEAFEHVHVIRRKEAGDNRSMFWRFLPASEPAVKVMISRDCDSRLSCREKAAVDVWLRSEKDVHIMRDHPLHKKPIMGGLWGVKYPTLKHMRWLIRLFPVKNRYGADEWFLRFCLFQFIRHRCLIHDEFYGPLHFPSTREGLAFVGERVDQHENPNKVDRALIQDALALGAVKSNQR